MWILKTSQPEFEVVDGAFAGRIYRHNQQYADIPPERTACFSKVAAPAEKVEKKAEGRKPVKKIKTETNNEKL